ncbi:Polyketide synthase [Tolypocladium paradoxum]|uniref:Polyketide synthase n=1 Tax=Tolypocladium paradoxum TaxID=94208 RepID=A0A2S4L2H8_9HYPO|nr:Polyketide synthase [Tolypocladium paradoxum]
MRLHIFGDRPFDNYSFFAEFCREGRPGVLAAAFIEQACLALRDEVQVPAKAQHRGIQVFRTLQQLNESHRSSTVKNLGVDNALVCLAQLCHYIEYVPVPSHQPQPFPHTDELDSRIEKHADDVEKRQEVHFAGVGVGLFAATAAASSASPATLIPLAVQAVLLAFRIGSHVSSIGDEIWSADEDSEPSESWTYIFPHIPAEEAELRLAQFHESHIVPAASRAYVSCVSADYVEISGPPPVLRTIIAQRVFEIEPDPAPVYGPYHAAHLHSSVDLDSILCLDDQNLEGPLEQCYLRSPVISSHDSWLPGNETGFIFKAAANACLNAPSVHQNVFDRCAKAMSKLEGRDCLVISHAPMPVAVALVDSLNRATNLDAVLKMTPQRSPETISRGIGNHGSIRRCKLAIVGMSGRFPDANTHEELWELLSKGVDTHRVVPKDRFPLETHVDPTGKAINTSSTPYGCWIQNPGVFDARFFSMSPREALQTDPMQRMAVTTAFEALEMSGYVPNRTPSTKLDRIGTFYGQASDDYREINSSQEIDTYYIPGGVRAFGPGRINYLFGFSGPSISIDTACSSSGAALQVACTSLLAKECDTAVVGGLSILSNPDIFSGLSRGHFLSKRGPCATFDDAADGYCRADACASVVVKRMEDAIADKDNILAVILGTATNHSADAISITHPHGPTQSALSSAILDDAGVDPLDVDFIEMHGTGTQAGDSTEMESVTNVFAPRNRKRPRDRPLYLGSVKSNVGHSESASGVTALIKVLKMLQHNAIPPHIGIKSGSVINTSFPKDLSERNVNIAFQTTPFHRTDGKPRRVFINNFSAAGGNTGLLLEDAPERTPPSVDPRSAHLVTVTAKSKAALMRNAERLSGWMVQNPETPISHLAYTTTARRVQHCWRMSVVASNLNEARLAIKNKLESSAFSASPGKQPSVAFVFTGQGSHYSGMGSELYAHYSVFRKAIAEFDRIAQIHGFPSFISIITGSKPEPPDPSPIAVQLAICCLEMALVRLWASWGVQPSVVLGHSLGEYAALNAAGVLSASDAIYLVGERARLVVERCTPHTHAMLAVRGSVISVMEALGSSEITVTCVNNPQETVLGGEIAAISGAAQQLGAAGFKCTQLRVPFAFHSDQINPILDDLEKTAGAINFSRPKISILSPLLGGPLDGKAVDAMYMRNHARTAVNFLGALLSAQSRALVDEKTFWIEVGPHSICTNMIKATLGTSTVAVPTLRRNESVHTVLSNSLSILHSKGLDLDWNEFHRDFYESTQLVELPCYSFDEKNYWLPYEGDWTLSRKAKSKAQAAIEQPKPKLSTTSVHEITKEEVKGKVAVVETETNLSRDDIRPVVTGHLCNGAPLCPSSMYADMAMTVADYAFKLLKPHAKTGLNIADMQVPKALLFDDKLNAHILRCTVEANATLGHARVSFHTQESSKKIEHAFCRVYYEDLNSWAAEFERKSYLVRARMNAMVAEESSGDVSRIGRRLAYKLFTSLVDYELRFQGMDRVYLNSAACEATADIVFRTTADDGNFFFSPYWIDSCAHLSGFILNGTDAVDSQEQVFISHGWETLRFIESLDPETTYQSYNRMHPVKGTKMMAGDVYVFDGDRLVGVAGGVKFQSIPRKVLNTVLPPRGGSAAGMLKGYRSAVPVCPTKVQESAPISSIRKSVGENTKRIDRPVQGAAKTRGPTSLIVGFLNIFEVEMGCDRHELADNIAFADIGCDSLMALTVTGRMREELEIDINSHTFLEYPTVGEFKAYLSRLQPAGGHDDITLKESPSCSISDDSSPDAQSDAFTTPSGRDSGSEDGVSCEDDSCHLRDMVRSTIATEMGIELEEILTAPDLTALGMDSLMGLTIVGTLREKFGLTIPNDLFHASISLQDIETSLGINGCLEPKSSPRSGTQESANVSTRVISSHLLHDTCTDARKLPPSTKIPDHLPHRKATSVLLQGNSRNATKDLFMIPDGSGCATSYAAMGQISPDWAVWGLFSPFMKTPEEFTCGIPGVALKFIDEIRRCQPDGPYNLAGWSVGGAIAFEIVRQLTQANEQVSHLILIDAPCPLIMDPLPGNLPAWFSDIGWLLPHFNASTQALADYQPLPIPEARCPQVMAIWCEDGVCKTPEDPRPDPYPTGHALFLLDNRVDFGPNRWDELLDGTKIETRHMPGNHFTMMRGELAKIVSSFVREAIAKPDSGREMCDINRHDLRRNGEGVQLRPFGSE